MVDLDPRLLRYFLAVARHRSFTGAAAALHISQPALSQAIRRLEGIVGAELLDRGTNGAQRGVCLTTAGSKFVPAAEDVLDASDRAVQAVQAVVQPTRLTVGFATGTPRTLTRQVLELAGSSSAVEIELQHVPWGQERVAVTSGGVDLVFLQAPPGLSDVALRAAPLLALHRMAVFHIRHPLARRTEVAVRDLAEEPIIDAASERAYWIVDPRPDNAVPRTVGPPARTVDEMLALVSAGLGMAITSATVAATNQSDELAFVPISDLDAATVYLAMRANDPRPAAAAVLDQMRTSRPRTGPE